MLAAFYLLPVPARKCAKNSGDDRRKAPCTWIQKLGRVKT